LDTLLSIEGLTIENIKLIQIQSTYRTLFFDVFEYLRLKIYSFTIFFFENSKKFLRIFILDNYKIEI